MIIYNILTAILIIICALFLALLFTSIWTVFLISGSDPLMDKYDSDDFIDDDKID